MPRLALIIGRFQPFHCGHEASCRAALEQADRLLLVLGSAAQPPSAKNPWNESEREALIRASLPDIAANRLCFAAVPDVFYNEDLWLRYVRDAVARHSNGAQVTLFGHRKDASSYYLALFPQWAYRELPNYQGISATPLREALLDAGPDAAEHCLQQTLADAIPAPTRAALAPLLRQAAFAQVCAEHAAIAAHRQAWAGSPYPPIFVTVDALVQHGEKILLVQRGQQPGRGQWALPGGYLDGDERLEAGARRELKEETGLDLAQQPHQLCASRAYDAPERSARGRYVTHLFHFRLDAAAAPAVAGADDAAVARWWPIAELDRTQMFEDHYCIIEHALDRYPR